MTADRDEASPAELLRAADHLLRDSTPSTRGVWPRTAAFLIRLALEGTLDELWQRVQPGLDDCAMRAQLLCLPGYVGQGVAGRVSAAWTALSRACHYHTYELPPTMSELRQWHGEVTALRHERLRQNTEHRVAGDGA